MTSIVGLILVICVSASVCYTTYEDSRNGEEHAATACQHRKLDPGERCDRTINCKYGGKCRAVADIHRDGTSVRFVMPPIESTDNKTVESTGIGFAMMERMMGQGSFWGPEECVCDFSCEDSRSAPLETSLCASNGKTYETECHMKRESCLCQSKIDAVHQGPCQSDRNGRHGTGVNNDFHPRIFAVGDCTTGCSYGATCDEETGRCICNVECAAQPLFHICGMDGRTYTNLCHVKRAQCRYQKGIDILYRGPCRRDSGAFTQFTTRRTVRENVNCGRLDCNGLSEDPVCGTDDVTYSSECAMKRVSCRKGHRIKVKHKYGCDQHVAEVTKHRPLSEGAEDLEDNHCDGISCHHGGVCIKHEEFHFICSCDAICEEDAAAAPDMKQKASTVEAEIITLDTERGVKSAWAEEREDNMSRRPRRRGRKHRRSNRRRSRQRSIRSIEGPRDLIYEVLCGTDNMTYSNECQMKKHACHEQMEITIAHRGACVRPVIFQQNHAPTTTQVSVEDVRIEMRDEVINSDLFQPFTSQAMEDEHQVATMIEVKPKYLEDGSRQSILSRSNNSVIQATMKPNKTSLPSPVTDSTPERYLDLSDAETSTARAFETSAGNTNEDKDESSENLGNNKSKNQSALQTREEVIKSSLWETSTLEEGVIFTNHSSEATTASINGTITSNNIDELFVQNETKIPTSTEGEENIVALVLGIIFGQMIIVATLVAIFLFLRKRNEMKEITSGEQKDGVYEKGHKENATKEINKISGV